ncbi:MAG: VOC family protein [Gammaproteobacteria bacterium]|jgi:predicted enzyme related to lactoylglutathione lyase|nr:VOC family protein [Gammaproteobacteria bacterium]
MKHIFSGIIFMLISLAVFASNDEGSNTMNDELISESTVMLYYKDLKAPRTFYKDVLGLTATFEDDWVSLYKLTATSAVGLVKEGGTAYHKANKDSAVMLSLTVNNVDTWYEKIKANQSIVILKEIYDHGKAPIRAFVVEDPGGYTVEIFQWVKK